MDNNKVETRQIVARVCSLVDNNEPSSSWIAMKHGIINNKFSPIEDTELLEKADMILSKMQSYLFVSLKRNLTMFERKTLDASAEFINKQAAIGYFGIYRYWYKEVQKDVIARPFKEKIDPFADYFGKIKTRQTVGVCLVRCNYSNSYGRWFYEAVTSVGNRIVFVHGNHIGNVGDNITISGRIKNHENRDGFNTTLMTHVKLVP